MIIPGVIYAVATLLKQAKPQTVQSRGTVKDATTDRKGQDCALSRSAGILKNPAVIPLVHVALVLNTKSVAAGGTNDQVSAGGD